MFKFNFVRRLFSPATFNLDQLNKIYGPVYGPYKPSSMFLLCTKLKRNLFGVRYFVTDADVKKAMLKNNVIRTSTYDSSASELIAAITKKDYKRARYLVEVKQVNVNGHNLFENTPLTNAAERNDVDGIKFLITQLGANVHASCDCPDHKTALHYAAENGHSESTKVLIDLGANPHVLNSRKLTPLQLTNNPKIKLLLEQKMKQTGFLPNTKQNITIKK